MGSLYFCEMAMSGAHNKHSWRFHWPIEPKHGVSKQWGWDVTTPLPPAQNIGKGGGGGSGQFHDTSIEI